jgi:hypothetical protein
MEEREIIITCSNIYNRKGIIGIGRNINESDRGKRMVRVAPLKYDEWSWCVAIYDNINYVLNEVAIITDIDNNYIYCKDDFIDFKLCINRYNDGNWMVVDDFIEWIQNNNLDSFKKEDSVKSNYIKSNSIKSNSIKSYPSCNPNPITYKNPIY